MCRNRVEQERARGGRGAAVTDQRRKRGQPHHDCKKASPRPPHSARGYDAPAYRQSSISGESGRDELLEARHELLALAEQPTLVDEPRTDTPLHALDENAVLRPHLAVERE